MVLLIFQNALYNHLAISSLSADFSPPDNGKIKIFIVVGAVVLALLLTVTILGILWCKGCIGGSLSREKGNHTCAYRDVETR